MESPDRQSGNSNHVPAVARIVMSAFVFPDNLEEGMRASVVCSVVSGDPPITIKWFKDGREIGTGSSSTDPMLKIVSITEFVSSLIIDRLDRSFSGNYTCKASSDFAGSANHTARLSVRSKPVWILKPASQTVIAGSSARLDCLADGFPEPVIRWKRVRGSSRDASSNAPFHGSAFFDDSPSSSSDQRNTVTILSSPRIHVLENGSLVIKSVQVEDQGKYFCEASNGVSKSEETSAELLVYEAPTVRPVSNQLSIKRSERTEISCRAVGSPLLQFRWFKNDQPLRVNERSFLDHYSIHEDESNRRERMTVLMINSVTRNDSAVFTCQASNHYGTDRANIRLLVQEPPDAPSGLRFLEISSRSVTLSWSIAFNGNSPIIGYEIVHRASHGESIFKRKDTTNDASLL